MKQDEEQWKIRNQLKGTWWNPLRSFSEVLINLHLWSLKCRLVVNKWTNECLIYETFFSCWTSNMGIVIVTRMDWRLLWKLSMNVNYITVSFCVLTFGTRVLLFLRCSVRSHGKPWCSRNEDINPSDIEHWFVLWAETPAEWTPSVWADRCFCCFVHFTADSAIKQLWPLWTCCLCWQTCVIVVNVHTFLLIRLKTR